MERVRKPFQGVSNIVRFNWHFYAAAVVLAITVLCAAPVFGSTLQWIVYLCAGAAIFATFVSLGVSFHIYDRSGLYRLPWIDGLRIGPASVVVNINAGFDETSGILEEKLPGAELHVWDFYDPERHAEISLKRARSACPPHPRTVSIQTDRLPMTGSQAGLICLFFAAHEIRSPGERRKFFEELHRILKDGATVCVTEHLRDWPNFLAYTIGILHFYSRTEWLAVFDSAGFAVVEERKETPFVSTFLLTKHDAGN